MYQFPWYSLSSFFFFLHCRLRLSERDLRDELDAVRISAQARENELLDKIKCLESNQQLALEEVRFIFIKHAIATLDH